MSNHLENRSEAVQVSTIDSHAAGLSQDIWLNMREASKSAGDLAQNVAKAFDSAKNNPTDAFLVGGMVVGGVIAFTAESPVVMGLAGAAAATCAMAELGKVGKEQLGKIAEKIHFN